MAHPESFADTTIARQLPEQAPLPRRHDAAYLLAVIDDGFGDEMHHLAMGSALDRPTGERQETPASEVFGVSREKGKEANRTSANDFLRELAQEGSDEAYAAFTDIQRKRTPQNVLQWPTFQRLSQVTQRILSAPGRPRTFRGLNVYSDYGKTNVMVDWGNSVGLDVISTDHDDLIATLLKPEHIADRRRLLSSFDTFDASQQASMTAILSSGFHFAQLKNGQNLPRHLEKFYELAKEDQELSLLQAIFDIGGAQGDTITNGSGTLTESMTTWCLDEMDILLAEEHEHLPPRERAQVAYDKILLYHDQRFGFGYDPANPDPRTRAFVRLGMMFRDAKPEDLATIPAIFDRLGEVTQAHTLDFLNATGYEAEGGAVWSMYSSTLAAKFLKDMTKAGIPFDEAMAGSIRLLARINEAARRYIDVTDAPYTNVVARDLVEAAEQDWELVLKQNIVAQKYRAGQARLFLQSPPAVTMEPDGVARPLEQLESLAIPPQNNLWVAGGGGFDSYAAALVADTMLGQEDALIVSAWGEPDRVRNAIPIGDSGRVFLATPNTELTGLRQAEHLLAARGVRSVLVCLERRPEGRSNLYDDFRRVIDHFQMQPAHIGFVDTGGDVLERSTLSETRPSRDHLSLAATARLQRDLGSIAGNTIILIPGVGAPVNMDEVLQELVPYVYNLAPHAPAFQERMAADGLPSADPKLYSRMLNVLWYATHPKTLSGQYGVQPLLLPVASALARTRARPSFDAVTEPMSKALILDTQRLAQVIGLR